MGIFIDPASMDSKDFLFSIVVMFNADRPDIGGSSAVALVSFNGGAGSTVICPTMPTEA